MNARNMLRTGDPCPCCGQPIKTKDPDLLRLLTHIRDSGAIQFGASSFNRRVSDPLPGKKQG